MLTLLLAIYNSSFILYILSYLLVSRDVFLAVINNIRRKEFFDENFLMFVAIVGAFLIGEYPEAVSVMMLYQIGEMFQDYAVNRSRQSIGDLLDIRDDFVYVIMEDKIQTIDVNQVKIGDEIIAKPSERTSLDGVVIEGESYLDTSALTGESMLRFVDCRRRSSSWMY